MAQEPLEETQQSCLLVGEGGKILLTTRCSSFAEEGDDSWDEGRGKKFRAAPYVGKDPTPAWPS